MHVFYYGNEMLDIKNMWWTSNGFQWEEEKIEGEGYVIDKTHNLI